MAPKETAQKQLHFILVPFPAQGHMIPMIDIARLLAQRGVIVSLVTTTLNAARSRSIIDRANESGLRIRLLELCFPSRKAGLPQGCENLEDVPMTIDMVRKFLDAVDMLQEPLECYLQDMEPFPSCMIADVFVAWTSATARKFGVPRVFFNGGNCFSLLCLHNLHQSSAHEQVESDTDLIVVPGLPHRVEVMKVQLPVTLVGNVFTPQYRDRVREAECTAYGVVLNSFDALEPEYIDWYRRTTDKKAWAIGPVSLCNRETPDKMDRGNKSSIHEDLCLTWLNSRKPKSVIYVCFGTTHSRLLTSQLLEIGQALEASNCSFIWVIRNSDKLANPIEKWLEEGFEEKVKEKGLIIRGWAPQVLILNHPSTGGFLTHCGWNSTLEAISAGVPMITWPLSAEQFFNEKMIVDILEVGVRIGTKVATHWGEQENAVVVKMEAVKMAIERLMDVGAEGEEKRRKALELSVKAKMAMEESCGSSYVNMRDFIQDVIEKTSNC